MPEKLVTFREIPRNSCHDTFLLSRGKPSFSFPPAAVMTSGKSLSHCCDPAIRSPQPSKFRNASTPSAFTASLLAS